ncbi:Zinc finger protein 383 [Portunus trituberculatus]|uniref:Zinc finger protein 383 n=1 Tax=Portunus trituberculatus TaxID=210409 RepID=A0A5B7ERN3_PORTR|nr:Zinc finger protein 383 [Portunus trituberculatus]
MCELRRHTGEKPYVCSHCNKGFTCSKVLKIHVRTHTGEKPFQCEHCQKGFAAYANLVVHRRIHTRERPYVCHLCGRAFEHSGNLSRHVRVHRAESGVRCIPCGQVFPCDKDLITHTGQHHPNEHTRDEDVDVESPVAPVVTTINMQDLEPFQPPSAPQPEPPQHSESQFTVLTPLAPPAVPIPVTQVESIHTPMPQPPPPEEGPADTSITVSDCEDSGLESGGSVGYATSPDQAYDRPMHQSPEANKAEEQVAKSSELKVSTNSTISKSAAVPRDGGVATIFPPEAPTPAPTFRMPPKKQQYPGARSPLSVLRTALSSQTPQPQDAATPATPTTGHHLTILTPPTVTLPSEMALMPEANGPNSPHLNMHQLSLNHQPGAAITPVGLAADPYSRLQPHPPGGEAHPEETHRDAVYRASLPVQYSSNGGDVNPLDLSQPPFSHRSLGPADTTPLNLSQRLAGGSGATVSSTQPHAPPSCHSMPPHTAAPPLPRSKVEDVEVIVDDDIPNEKFLPCLQKTKIGMGVPPSPLDSIRENIQRSLFSLMPGEHEADAFKRKVETALVALVGEVPMKQLGYPEKTAEQVLITILDMARKSPCADVRVDELQRLKVNMRKFLEYGFPSASSWEELGWSGRSIDAIIDNIISWISRKKQGDLRACSGRLLEEGATKMLVGAGAGAGMAGTDSEDIKVNGTPLKAS